jgi:phage-related protein
MMFRNLLGLNEEHFQGEPVLSLTENGSILINTDNYQESLKQEKLVIDSEDDKNPQEGRAPAVRTDYDDDKDDNRHMSAVVLNEPRH